MLVALIEGCGRPGENDWRRARTVSAAAAQANMVTPMATAVPCPASPIAEAARPPTRNCSSPCSEDAAPAAEP